MSVAGSRTVSTSSRPRSAIRTVTVLADPFQPPRMSDGAGALVNVNTIESPCVGLPRGPPALVVCTSAGAGADGGGGGGGGAGAAGGGGGGGGGAGGGDGTPGGADGGGEAAGGGGAGALSSAPPLSPVSPPPV